MLRRPLILLMAIAIGVPAAMAQQPSATIRVVESADGLYQFPIVVNDVRPAAGAMELVADVEFIGPDGISKVMAKQCCRAMTTGQPVTLSPTMNTKLTATDVNGTYTVRATISGGPEVLVATGTFSYAGGTAPAGASPAPGAAPRLNMDVPAKNPGSDTDKRYCLSLPTPTEVIKCTERKK